VADKADVLRPKLRDQETLLSIKLAGGSTNKEDRTTHEQSAWLDRLYMFLSEEQLAVAIGLSLERLRTYDPESAVWRDCGHTTRLMTCIQELLVMATGMSCEEALAYTQHSPRHTLPQTVERGQESSLARN
jgi:hypothetical protein